VAIGAGSLAGTAGLPLVAPLPCVPPVAPQWRLGSGWFCSVGSPPTCTNSARCGRRAACSCAWHVWRGPCQCSVVFFLLCGHVVCAPHSSKECAGLINQRASLWGVLKIPLGAHTSALGVSILALYYKYCVAMTGQWARGSSHSDTIGQRHYLLRQLSAPIVAAPDHVRSGRVIGSRQLLRQLLRQLPSPGPGSRVAELMFTLVTPAQPQGYSRVGPHVIEGQDQLGAMCRSEVLRSAGEVLRLMAAAAV
jgi:hypothetical protein